jgi:hypothetical protein
VTTYLTRNRMRPRKEESVTTPCHSGSGTMGLLVDQCLTNPGSPILNLFYRAYHVSSPNTAGNASWRYRIGWEKWSHVPRTG